MNELLTAGAIIEYDGKILLLLRCEQEKLDPNTWGFPAGRVEPGEELVKTTIREIQEETGHRASGTDLEELGTFRWKTHAYDIVFYGYKLTLQKPIEVTLNPEEHTDYCWKTPEEILKLENLMIGVQETIKAAYFSEDNK